MTKLGLFSSTATQAGRPPHGLAGELHDASARAVLGDWYEQHDIDARNDLGRVARIAEITARLHEIDTAIRAGRPQNEVLAMRFEKRNISREGSAIQYKLRDEFAAARGWSSVAQSRSEFEFAELAMGRLHRERNVPWSTLDVSDLLRHEECFRTSSGAQPAALLTHSNQTDDRAPFEALAAAAGLAIEVLPFSWYEPRNCVAVLFMRPPTWRPAPSRKELDREAAREIARRKRARR